MVTRFQERALKKFAKRAVGWEKPANHPGIGDDTFKALVQMGYLKERLIGVGQEWGIQLTEQGRQAVYEDIWPC